MIVSTVVEILKEDVGLAALVADRVYPMQMPDAPTYPALVVSKATALTEATMGGSANLESCRIQVDVFSGSYAATENIATLVKRLLHCFSGGPARSGAGCAIDSSFCILDQDLPVGESERAGPRLRRRVVEFQIWHTEL